MANSPNAIAGTYLVGAPGVGVRSTAATFVGSYSQPPTANSLLVAVLMGGGTTGTATNFSQFTGTTGWTQVLTKGNYTDTTCHSRVEVWTKTAAGNDAAPTFSNPFTGTIAAQCVIYELSNPNATPVDVSNTYGSGTASGSITSASLSLATSGNVAGTGEFAISAYATEIPGGAATNTWAHGSAFSNNGYNDASTSSFVHTATDWKAGPASGSTLTDAPTITTFTGYAAGLIVVFKQATGQYYPYGSISAVGMLASGNSSGATTLAVSPQFVGDALVFVSKVTSSTLTVSNIAGSGTTGWTKVAGTFVDTESGNVRSHEIWLGKVTAAGATTLTVTWSSSNSGLATDYDCMEFTNGYGSTAASTSSWARDGTQQANQNNVSSTTINWANITATAAGELWVGMNREVGGTYYWAANNHSISCLDSNANCYVYNTNPGSGSLTIYSTQPVATISHTLDVLIISSYGQVITPTAFSGTVAFSAPTILAKTAITTSVFSGTVSFPAPTITTLSPNANIIPTTFAGTVSFPSATIAVNAPITPTSFSGSVAFSASTVLAKTLITTTSFAGTVAFPSENVAVNAPFTTTALSGTVAFPAPTILANTVITTTSFAGTVAFPAPSVTVKAAITTTALLGTVAFPAPTILAQTAFTTTAFSGSVSFPGPTVSVNAAIVPTTFSGSVSFPAPTVGAGGGSAAISLTTFTTTVSFTSPTIVATTNIVPSVLNTSVAFSAPTITAITSITTTALLGSVTFPSTTVLANTAISPSVFSGSVAFPSSTVLAVTNIVPTAFAGTVSFPASTISVKASITTSVFSGSVAFPAITATVSAPITTTVFNGTVAFPSTTETVSAFITTSVFNGTVAFPALTIATGSGAAISPTTFVGSVAFSASTVLANTAITPSVFSGSVTFSGPSIAVNAPIAPSVFSTSATFFTPTISVSAAITTSVLNGTVAFPAPSVAVNALIAPTVLSGTVAFAAPTMRAVTTITPTAFSGSVAFSGPSVAVSAPITTTVLAGSVSFPAPATAVSAIITTALFSGSVAFIAPTVNVNVGIVPSTLYGSVVFPAPIISAGSMTNAFITTVAFIGSVIFPALTVHSMIPIPDSGIGGTASSQPIGGIVGTPNIGGTASANLVGGTAIAAKPISGTANGTLVEGIATTKLLVGGTAANSVSVEMGTAGMPNALIGGNANQANYGGSETSKIMAIMINLSGYENNDSTFYLQALNNGYPLPLTGYTNNLVVKPSPSVADNTGTTYTVGSGLTLTNSSQGMITFVLPHTAAQTAGTSWWRWDIIDGGLNVTTVMFGNLYILPV